MDVDVWVGRVEGGGSKCHWTVEEGLSGPLRRCLRVVQSHVVM